jgi:hypothetical protein
MVDFLKRNFLLAKKAFNVTLSENLPHSNALELETQSRGPTRSGRSWQE